MKKIFYSLLMIMLLLFACNSKEKKKIADKEDYEKAQEILEVKEKKNPTAFLRVSNKSKHNLLGQTVIKGSLANNAKICVYYDIVLQLSFISKTGALLEKDSETIYETVEPGKSTNFKTKYFSPKGTGSVSIVVISAKTK